MVAELIDGLTRLAHRLLANRAGVPPLQWEVLPQQHAQLIGGVVQLGTGDVPVHPQEVETGLAGQFDVAAQFGRRGVAQRHSGRRKIGALDEHRLAVDREDPILQHHLAQPGAHASGVADDLVDPDLDLDLRQLLVSEGPRPPQPRIVDVEGPIDLVEPSRE